ncbi:MAG: hypothetical protein K2O38_03450 [Muribaculaceae bacterium]|nr:hypothetical protein [Muribaculaceae bacterium]MDE7110939.1 hypothetical protein [Muribaculaceae bacterium]
MSNEPQLKDTVLRRLVQGRLVTGHFFMRYWLQIFVLIAMILVYITNRYSCQRAMEQIRVLTSRLEVVETESFRVRGLYMSRIRESAMRTRLDSLGIPLAVQIQPPYHLSANETESN